MKIKGVFRLMAALMVCLFVGAPAAHAVGLHPGVGVGGAAAISTILSFMPQQGGVLQDVALMEMWERELIDKFRHEHGWMSRLTSRDNYVNNNIINLTEIGVDPDVLIDNNTYPIPVVDREDDNIPVSLKKFETKNTQITDDELYALPYDKEGSVVRDHREALEETTATHGLHSLAPSAADENNGKFIIETSGADDGTGRARLVSKDVIRLKRKYDDYGVPNRGRILVLCSEHIEDLLIEDKALEKQYHNHTQGAIAMNYYGFELYEDVYNPVYDGNNDKKAYGAASAGTDRNASTAFYLGRCFKARGSVNMYKSNASEDPENRRTVVGFRLWHLVLPTKQEGFGAIVSVDAA